MKFSTTRILLGLLILLAFLLNAAGLWKPELLSRLEAMTYDQRLQLMASHQPFDGLAIVAIDEKSLASEGRWPWSRERMAALVDQLIKRYHVAAVGFDIVFAEAEKNAGLDVVEHLGRQELSHDPAFQALLPALRTRLDADRRFAAQLRGQPVVLGYYFTSGTDQHVSGALPPPLFTSRQLPPGLPIVHASGFGANVPALAQAATGGHFNPLVDMDGVVRRVPMLTEYHGAYYESLSLATVRQALGNPPVTPLLASEQKHPVLEGLRMGDLSIPVDAHGNALVPYRGRQGSFAYYSATDVLHGRLPARALDGRIILIGATAPGLMDLRSTPMDPVYPGVEVHANLISGILDQSLLSVPDWVTGADIALLLVIGVSLALLLPFLSPLRASLLATLATIVALALNLYAWRAIHLVLPLADVLLMTILLYVSNMAFGFFSEARNKRQIASMFGQYVPPALVDRMSRDPGAFDMRGESREMTVLFCDVCNFTRISEGLDPQQLSQMMNAYLTPMTRIIHQHGGTIDKYIGDAIMAFWGAPLPDAGHARHAVEAALAMQAALLELGPEFRARGWPELRIGIGVNTGVMRVGNMGSDFRRAYTVMGDAVNLASRLEGLTRQYGVPVIVGDHTRQAAPTLLYRELDWVKVKGRNEPVPIFEPMGQADEQTRASLGDELGTFAEALACYRAMQWEQCLAHLSGLCQARPEHPLYRLFLARAQAFMATPPADDWDGVFEATSK